MEETDPSSRLPPLADVARFSDANAKLRGNQGFHLAQQRITVYELAA